MNRYGLLISIILVSLIINPFVAIPARAYEPEGGTIEGDSIYWENDWGRLEVYPHTVYGEITQEQWCNATWKLAANDLDIAFRFNFSLINPKIWENVSGEWIDRTSAFEHTVYNGKHYYYVENVHFEQFETRRFRWKYDVPFNSSGKWDFMGKLSGETIQYALDNDRYILVDPWWDSNWLYSRQITINSAYIENDLTDFPVFVKIPQPVCALADGGNSLRFTTFSNSSKLMYEIEYFRADGESYAWVRVPTVNQSAKDDTKFMMYYGNSGASDNQSPSTWSNNYQLVYHMDDLNDSSPHYNNASFANGSSIHNSGRFGRCRYLPTAEIVVPSTTSINEDLNQSYTVSMFVRIGTTANRRTVNKGGGTSNRVISGDRKTESGQIVFRNEIVSSGGNPEPDVQTVNVYEATSTWYHVAYSYKDEEPQGLKIYVNGTYDSKDSSSPGNQDTQGFTEDDMDTGLDLLIGHSDYYIDEVRISKINRTESWINATYKNINESNFVIISGVINAPDLFTANATTNITRTNATLNAYIPDDKGGLNAEVGFWYGTNNPPTDADTNVTYGTIYFSGGADASRYWDNYTGDILTENTTYYVKAWADLTVPLGGYFYESSNVEIFTTNGSVNPPYNVEAEIVTANSSLKITWDAGLGADNTTIVRKIGSYPTSVTDGTVVHNHSRGDVDHYEEDLTQNYFFRMWSYNQTYNEYSTSVDVEYGALILHCYNESNPDEMLTFNVEIKNQNGTEVYAANGITDGHLVDLVDIPLGDKTAIKVNATDYFTRLYYVDLEENNVYNLSFYLAHTLKNLSDDDSEIAEIYLLQVIDETGQSISDVKIQVMRLINHSGDVAYRNISVMYTDGDGRIELYLIPGIIYQVVLTKEGYITQYSDYLTSDVVFTRTFRLAFSAENYTGEEVEPEVVSFVGYIHRTAVTLYLNYSDSLGLTINAQIWIYEFNYSTNTSSLFASYYYNDTNNFQRIVTPINNSNAYFIILHYNHTTFGHITRTLIFERLITLPTTEEEFNVLWELNYGSNPFGWSNSILFLIACAIYFEGGQSEAAFFMIVFGALMIFINSSIGFNTTITTIAGGGIPILHIVVGVGMAWRDSKKIQGGLR